MIYLIQDRKKHNTQNRIYSHENGHRRYHLPSYLIQHKGVDCHIQLQKLIRQKPQYCCQLWESPEKGLDKNHDKGNGYGDYSSMGLGGHQHGQKQDKQNAYIAPHNHQQIFLNISYVVKAFPTGMPHLNDTICPAGSIDTKYDE